MLKPYKKQEIIGTLIILAVVISVTLLNMRVSLRRSRDSQRKDDIGAISDALGKFYADYSFFPPSENGKIKMCKADNFNNVIAEVKSKNYFDKDLFFTGLKACEWGKDTFTDLLDEKNEPYMKTIPSDPKTDQGITYIYLSSQNRYQLYTYLEGEADESGYDLTILRRNLKCGKYICSFGKSYAVPLDRDIAEYEKELLEKK